VQGVRRTNKSCETDLLKLLHPLLDRSILSLDAVAEILSLFFLFSFLERVKSKKTASRVASRKMVSQ